jgi:hypothetical protein
MVVFVVCGMLTHELDFAKCGDSLVKACLV